MAKIFEPVTLGPWTLKNRIIRSATNEHLSAADGSLTPELMEAYLDVAKGGSAMFISGHYTVERDCRNDPGQPVLDELMDCEMMHRTIDEMHKLGCIAICQVSQPGPKATVFLNNGRARVATDYTIEELHALRDRYIQGAVVAKKAGFDGIQLHHAHGYCLSGFLDPVENTRTDEYGGAQFENRFRLSTEIIKGIREACGEDYPILVKLNCNASKPEVDYREDFIRAVQGFKDLGVLMCEVSGYTFAAFEPKFDEPYYLNECLQAGVLDIMPIALVGGLDSRAKLQQAVDAGFPLVSLSRSLINDPDYVNKLENGTAETSPCLRCKACYSCYRTRHVRCVLHKEIIPLLEKVFPSVDA